ncbi:MAG: hypothetical protein JWR26_3919 [Pedosphaera sp.]|nr:hypothetical protein [Pedosphaera sp.]
MKWRRERDSNPRKDCSFTGLANLRFRPLSHLSTVTGCSEKLVQKLWAGFNTNYVPSGTYFIRIRVNGKLFVRTLGGMGDGLRTSPHWDQASTKLEPERICNVGRQDPRRIPTDHAKASFPDSGAPETIRRKVSALPDCLFSGCCSLGAGGDAGAIAFRSANIRGSAGVGNTSADASAALQPLQRGQVRRGNPGRNGDAVAARQRLRRGQIRGGGGGCICFGRDRCRCIRLGEGHADEQGGDGQSCREQFYRDFHSFCFLAGCPAVFPRTSN